MEQQPRSEWSRPEPGDDDLHWYAPPPGGATASDHVGSDRSAAPRRRGAAFVGIAVASVLGLAAATFAVTSLAADGAPSSPEGAVEALFGAIGDQDALGVLDVMLPAERAVYQPFIEDMVGELQRLEVLDASLDLGSVDGVDFQVDDLALESVPLRDGVSVVRVVGGVLTSSLDPAGLPIGSWVREQLEDPDADVDLEPVSSTTRLGDDGPLEIVVIDDGGWHVSLHHSIAELARREAQLPPPDPAEAIVPDGADSPEAAVEELVRAAIDLDVRRVIALTPPGEMSALHQYAPLFLPDLDEAIAELRAESSYEVSLDRFDLAASRDGDEAVVAVTGFAASGVIDDEPFEVSYDGSCFTNDFDDGEVVEVCADDVGDGPGGDRPYGPLPELNLRTVERDGAWYVSPVGSLLHLSLDGMRAVERGDLDDPSMLFGVAYGFGLTPFAYAMSSSSGEVSSSSGFEQADGSSTTIVEDGCSRLFDDLPVDADEEQWADAERAFDECLAG